MVRVRVSPGEIFGTVNVPGSKSFTQRAILLSAFSETPLELGNVAFCSDDLIAINIARKCGLDVSEQKERVTITGSFEPPNQINAGESGTSLRLSIGLLSGKGVKTKIEMSPKLYRRPVRPIIRALEQNNARFHMSNNSLHLDATNCTDGAVSVDGSVSSQFISSLIMFQCLRKTNRKVSVYNAQVSKGYIDLTTRIIKKFGLDVKEDQNNYTVDGDFHRDKISLVSDGDYSSASFLAALGLLCSNSGIELRGLSYESDQPDSLFFSNPLIDREPLQETIKVSKRELPELIFDSSLTPDLAPVAAVLGIFSKNGVGILHINRLVSKESDRKKGIINLCRSFGADIIENEDAVFIKKGSSVSTASELYFDDHRMIMAGILAGIASGKSVIHNNVENIAKSYPQFLDTIQSLGAEVEYL